MTIAEELNSGTYSHGLIARLMPWLRDEVLLEIASNGRWWAWFGPMYNHIAVFDGVTQGIPAGLVPHLKKWAADEGLEATEERGEPRKITLRLKKGGRHA